VIWAVSVMLVFTDIPKPDVVYWQHINFNNVWDCRTYIAENKINLVDSVLKMYREQDGKKLKNFEFYCEGKIIGEEV
jgi:hypothetical protein